MSSKSDALEQLLSGGNPRSLGRAEEVVQRVLRNPQKAGELFDCLFSSDEIVKMRASDALEKVCRAKPALLRPFTGRLLTEVAAIPQASVRWHLAQMLGEIPLEPADRSRAIEFLKTTLSETDDWIVTNLTIESLAKLSRDDRKLRAELGKMLLPYLNSRYKSVVVWVGKLMKAFRRDAMREVKIDRAVYLAHDASRTYEFLRRNPDWRSLRPADNRRNKKSINGYTRELKDGRTKKFQFRGR